MSPAEADALRAIVAQMGVAPLPEVVTLATTVEADAFFVATDELNGVRTDIGLAPVTVIDLRQQPSTAASDATAPWYVHQGDGPTWYVVGSQAQAEEAGDVLS